MDRVSRLPQGREVLARQACCRDTLNVPDTKKRLMTTRTVRRTPAQDTTQTQVGTHFIHFIHIIHFINLFIHSFLCHTQARTARARTVWRETLHTRFRSRLFLKRACGVHTSLPFS